MSYGVGLRNGVAFALGTIPSLTSGGGLRPSLLLNFLSGSLDSRITFSRGTQATQYTSNGTLQYAPNNLLTYSNQADNAAWTKSNSFVQTNLVLQSQTFNTSWTLGNLSAFGSGSVADATVAPDGTLTADRLAVSTASAYVSLLQAVNVTASTTYTFSYWLNTTTSLSGNTIRIYNVTGAADIVAGQACVYSGGWVRQTCTFTTPVGCTQIYVYPLSVGVGAGTVGQYFDIWGAQLVQGSVPGDYVATTSAALPVLYADYQGKLRARKLCEDAATAAHNFNQATGVIGNTETLSFYAKAGERTWAISQLGSSSVAYFDLQNGVLGNVSAGTATITLISNGYYRCTLTGVRAGNASSYIYCTTGNGVASYAGNGSSGIYIADAQLEAGSTVQAYNDTTSAAYYGPRFDYDPTNYVRQNLLTYSEQIGGGNWITSGSGAATQNYAAAPNGTLTATRITNSGAFSEYIQVTVAPSTAYVFSFYAKNNGGTIANYRVYNNTGGADIIAQTSYFSSINSADYVRVSIAFTTPAGCTQINVYPHSSATLGGADVLVWGAQLNVGSTALTYTATTTAPYTLCAARGLLIEEQRTNYLIRSSEFDSSTWQDASPNFPTVTANAIISPDGTVNADLLTASTGGVNCASRQVAATGTTGNFTGSFFLKAGTSTRSRILLADTTTAFTVIGDFQIAWIAGVASVFSTTSGTASIVAVNNGWYRCIISASTASANASIALAVFPDVVSGTGTVYAYGAQAEAGAFATSYIPTVGSQVTRAADSASITTLTPWFNAAAGTMVASFDVASVSDTGNKNVWSFYTSATNNLRLWLWGGAPTLARFSALDVTQQVDITSSALTTNTVVKSASAYTLNNYAASFNGAAAGTDTSATVPVGFSSLFIGNFTGTTEYLNGHLQSLSYYPTRLPNATLQGITA